MTLLPEPATRYIRMSQSEKRTSQTFSMDPKKRTCWLPLLEDAALEKPWCSFLVMSTTCDVVVSWGVWWREPFVNTLPQLVSWKDGMAQWWALTRIEEDKRFNWSTLLAVSFLSERYKSYMPFRESTEGVLRTSDDLRNLIIDHLYSVINGMRNLQILCTGHPSFFLRQLVQPF